MYPLEKFFFLQKMYADNTYRQSFLFLNKHCHAIWQCRNHSSQVIGGTTLVGIDLSSVVARSCFLQRTYDVCLSQI
jgi:hypothetical protein